MGRISRQMTRTGPCKGAAAVPKVEDEIYGRGHLKKQGA